MPFPYYARLKPRDKAIYRKSDAIAEIELPRAARLHGEVAAVEAALLEADRALVERSTRALCDSILIELEAPRVRVRVLSARPSSGWGETHGEYEPVEGARRAGHVGLKSIIAYRTGLDIRQTSQADAAQAFRQVKERARRAGTIRLADKPLNDYLVLRALD